MSETATAKVLTFDEYLESLPRDVFYPQRRGYPSSPPKYASYVPRSAEAMRTHHELGHAKLSFYNRAEYYKDGGTKYHLGAIFEMVDGRWFVLHAVPEGCERKDLPWMRKLTDVSYERNPAFRNYSETPNEKSYLRVETPRYVISPMTPQEYAEWRIAVDRKLRENA